jgi:hypothetical protein
MAKPKSKAPSKQHACPNCGYCPHCGRSDQPPVIPAPYPVPIPARPWPERPHRPWYGPYWSVTPPNPEVGFTTTPAHFKDAVTYC